MDQPLKVQRFHAQVWYQSMLLAAVCGLATLWLLSVDRATAPQIAVQQRADRQAMFDAVLSPSLYENSLVDSLVPVPGGTPLTGEVLLYPAVRGGALVAVAAEFKVAGYGGPMQLVLAVDAQGTLYGVRLIHHRETPGLGDRMETAKSDWILAFNGRSLDNTPTADWNVQKDGGRFDQFTGATITPRALVRGVHAALQVVQAQRSSLVQAAAIEAMPDAVSREAKTRVD